ncbi:activity-regulated cytoskeleton associated protein 2-like [Diabrotica virgifera virgifera]|uniref:Activity-regulated cytoskeleton associated protein 2-like n=1 Tax=Diabrotica virgifera virgifera TaxID=50390 RepID=A0ABM5L1M2_DIAVI|nr:activity-regulated cytoskeleton associated protein 2-like [Diabrotica virgifera virgifera]
MSNAQFITLIQELRSSTLGTNEELLTRLRESSATPTLSPMTGNFVKCTARFDGSEHANVEAFLDNILTFKECTHVSDDNSLRRLSMLLKGTVATWWQGIKTSTLTWTNAVQALKDSFSKKLPPYLIFREIFAREQNTDEQTELFVCNVRTLLAHLPYTLSEEAELKIRKRLPRNRFQTSIVRI